MEEKEKKEEANKLVSEPEKADSKNLLDNFLLWDNFPLLDNFLLSDNSHVKNNQDYKKRPYSSTLFKATAKKAIPYTRGRLKS